jgi:phage portal protein BeeE
MKVHKDKYGNLIFISQDDIHFGHQEIDKETLLNEGYLTNAYAYMIVNRIAEKVAMLPKKYCDDDGNEKEGKEVDDFKELVKQSGGKEFLEKVTANFVALGEFFIVKQASVGFGTTKLDIVSPVSVALQTVSGQPSDDNISSFDISNGEYKRVLPEDMIFGKYPNIKPNTNRGLSPFEPMWDVVRASNHAFQAHGGMLRNMGANGIISPKFQENQESIPMTDPERNLLQKGFDRALTSFGYSRTPTNYGKTVVSKTPLDYLQLGFDPAKLKILEMNQDNLKVLSAGCNLDSKIFNDSEASTYNNETTAKQSAYLECYIPTANYVLKVLSDDLLPDGINWQVDLDRIDVINQRDQSREKETREGVIAVQNQVSDGKITVESGVAMLELIYGYSEEDAKMMLIIPEQPKQPVIEID